MCKGSRVSAKGHGSEVMGKGQGSVIRGQRSRVTDQGSLSILKSDFHFCFLSSFHVQQLKILLLL